jgi:hypothetical protein
VRLAVGAGDKLFFPSLVLEAAMSVFRGLGITVGL